MRLGEIIKEGVRLKDNSNSKNQKSNTQISNNFLVLLIVAAILFSVIGTWISLTRLSPLTGYLGAQQGIVNVTVNSTVAFSFQNSLNYINFSRLNPNDKDNTEDGSPPPINITNDGNSIINISVSAATLYQSAALATFYYQAACGNTTFDGNCSKKSNTTLPTYTNLLGNSFVIIAYLDFDSSNDTNSFHVNTSVPPNEPAGQRESILTFTATCTNHCLP